MPQLTLRLAGTRHADVRAAHIDITYTEAAFVQVQ
jgi:hypothetical protein